MAFGRFLVSWKADSDLPENTFTNTLYFNISGSGPLNPAQWDTLCADLHTLYTDYTKPSFTGGRRVTVKAYDMADAEPRPIKGQYTEPAAGTLPAGAPQVALCLSYYADRNLPRQRGRIYTGPWANSQINPSQATIDSLITLANGFLNLGGVDVDWSLYSPTTGDHTRINHGWVDNSWDIIRSRKFKATARTTFSGDG